MTELNPFGAFQDNIKAYIDEQIASAGTTDIDVTQAISDYLRENPVEADQVTPEQIRQAVQTYFDENPVQVPSVSNEQLQDAVASYMAANPSQSSGDKPLSYQPTVLDFGADPTGKTDSSQAFRDYIDTNPATVMVPSWGRFMIDSTVSIHPTKRQRMRGDAFSHFSSGSERATIFAGPNLGTDPMFENAYIVECIAFFGNDDTVCLDVNGYESRIERCSFNNFDIACRTDGGVHTVYDKCQFIGCDRAIFGQDGVSTVSYYSNNTFQYCRRCIDYEGEIYSSTFISNTFERIKETPVFGNVIYDCTFIGNWWEHTNAWDENDELVKVKIIDTYSGQQMMRGFESGSHIQAGFVDVFDTDKHSGNFGGVVTHGGHLRVRESTGRALKVDETGIYQELDDWSWNPDFVLRSGHARAAAKGSRFTIQPAKGTPVYFWNYIERDGSDKWPFAGLYFYTGKDSEGNDLWNKIKTNRNFGLTFRTTVSKKDKSTVEVLGATGLDIKWRSNGEGTHGLDIFDSTKATSAGVVRLDATNSFYFNYPVVNVTVTDVGVRFNGFEYISPSSNNTGCRGFVLHFVDSDNQPVTPSEFHMEVKSLD